MAARLILYSVVLLTLMAIPNDASKQDDDVSTANTTVPKTTPTKTTVPKTTPTKTTVPKTTPTKTTPTKTTRYVVFMHGIFGGPKDFDKWRNIIASNFPLVETRSVDAFNGLDSTVSMWEQVNKIALKMKPLLTNPLISTVVVCYSQGGLLCRGILSVLEHNVETFIALSSPLAGQFGDTDFVKYLFPHLLRDEVYRVAYTKDGQKLSVSGYWNDPRQHDLYLAYSQFLAVLNNETTSANSNVYKTNFIRIKNLVMIGGPDDGVIMPWESSQFGMYNKSMTVLSMMDQQWFKNDAFGLQTLYKRGAMTFFVLPGVKHLQWPGNVTVFEKCIRPWI